jgi:hypothetical protein
MTCASVTIRLRKLIYVNLTNQSVTYVSGTFVTLDSGLNTPYKGGEIWSDGSSLVHSNLHHSTKHRKLMVHQPGALGNQLISELQYFVDFCWAEHSTNSLRVNDRKG